MRFWLPLHACSSPNPLPSQPCGFGKAAGRGIRAHYKRRGCWAGGEGARCPCVLCVYSAAAVAATALGAGGQHGGRLGVVPGNRWPRQGWGFQTRGCGGLAICTWWPLAPSSPQSGEKRVVGDGAGRLAFIGMKVQGPIPAPTRPSHGRRRLEPGTRQLVEEEVGGRAAQVRAGSTFTSGCWEPGIRARWWGGRVGDAFRFGRNKLTGLLG